ncbi:2-oxo acid dehydrogenase subunit E2 [Halobacillus shinanisalinarum]|uniref:Dihydrolipoamide acetyltransferase component of pyruvate dehydrogenase complex n=1 Tax=Halobacillus shinanisalinarum TaxID=2932258 RepID=A0ABY4GVB0_9BACI|nr:dihydrolipoamide acetyltransferase family protein [Halobacillus shinanisalinarum]UOQ92063.1 2-oxo acid dehydrogenase subunit E2 [Halobacillus shinanisalinarum]
MDVKLHDIGEGMHEAEILHYFVKKGEPVKNDAPLVEIQTDKMTAELTAPSDGIIGDIKFELGEVVEVGTTILTITTDQKEPSPNLEPTVKASPSEASGGVATQPATRTLDRWLPMNRVMASPHTRRVARENDVNIKNVTGTGRAGRVLDEDIFAYIEAQTQAAPVAEEKSHQDEVVIQNSKEVDETVQTIPFKGRRKQIAKKMTQSLYTAPHVTHFDEVDMTELLHLKKQLKEGTTRQPGISISVAAFFIKALQLSLEEFPIFNSKLDEEKEEIYLESSYNIGLATGTDKGLIVPVLKNVENLSLVEIHEQMKTLTKKATENKLSGQDLRGGTFTISNVGPMGSTGATPILNYPETGLMAFHKTKKMPVVINDEIVIREMMNVTLTFDHRVADGSQSIAFTNKFIDYIEKPHLMLVELT